MGRKTSPKVTINPRTSTFVWRVTGMMQRTRLEQRRLKTDGILPDDAIR